jgi:hypothetical protein
MKNSYYSFNTYLKEKFGQRIQRISIDAGFNCPNLDGTLSKDGCVFCNNKGFGTYAGSRKTISEQITESIDFYKKRLGVNKFIAYFQSFTNTYDELENLKQRYDQIRKFPDIVGLFISTRPDCVDEEKLQLIADYRKDYLVWIEYGLQTTHNHILSSINRNHTYEDFLKALNLTRKYEINTGVHMILGLPGATYQDMIEDARRISCLDIQGIKFHILHVLRGSGLEHIYEQGKVELLSEDEYVRIVCDFIEQIPPSWAILRLVSSAFSDYLVGPQWINKKQKIIKDIQTELERRGTYQGYSYASLSCKNK